MEYDVNVQLPKSCLRPHHVIKKSPFQAKLLLEFERTIYLADRSFQGLEKSLESKNFHFQTLIFDARYHFFVMCAIAPSNNNIIVIIHTQLNAVDPLKTRKRN